MEIAIEGLCTGRCKVILIDGPSLSDIGFSALQVWLGNGVASIELVHFVIPSEELAVLMRKRHWFKSKV
jgi:hypothetical protein